jgi:Zn-dependent peptidase ImmA (M78 family)/transcriptional regulator with XRE-family HTH domain
MTTRLIGARIRALREERKLSQDDLARLFGFRDRQTVSAIETGERRVSAEELLLAVEKLGASLDYFTDPFMLVGEGKFSWRQESVGSGRLSAYERVAGRWIAAFRAVAPQVGRASPLLRRALGLTRHHQFEDAMEAGERFAVDFKLGEVPALHLAEVMERELRILVLMVDAFQGISGAACRLPELDVVLINRQEIIGRRNFDLAHELFHILTWDAMPPEHSEESRETGGNRIEQLANNFASALLMPREKIERFGNWSALENVELITRLNVAADELKVTSSALRWRLVALDKLKLARARAIPETALINNGRETASVALPPLFSRPFMEVISLAIVQGRVSARRAAGLLDVTLDDLIDLFATHGVEPPYDL